MEPAVTAAEAFKPRKADEHSFLLPDLEWLAGLGEEEFRDLFRGSAIRRAKWRGVVRNACVALGNSAETLEGYPAARPRVIGRLERLASSSDPLIVEHAHWALAQLARPAGKCRPI